MAELEERWPRSTPRPGSWCGASIRFHRHSTRDLIPGPRTVMLYSKAVEPYGYTGLQTLSSVSSTTERATPCLSSGERYDLAITCTPHPSPHGTYQPPSSRGIISSLTID